MCHIGSEPSIPNRTARRELVTCFTPSCDVTPRHDKPHGASASPPRPPRRRRRRRRSAPPAAAGRAPPPPPLRLGSKPHHPRAAAPVTPSLAAAASPFRCRPRAKLLWYPRSPPPAGPAAAEKAPEEDVRAEGEGAYLHDAGGADFGEVVATSAASADAAGVAAAGDGGSASGFAVSSLIDILDGFHNLTGIPWYASFAVVTALAAIGWNSRPHLKCGSSPV